MGTTMSLIRGLALGAGAMYFLDARSGKRRRAMIRDKADMAVTDFADLMGKAGRDLQNRAQGMGASARSLFDRTEVADDVLVQRIRSRMGRLISRPSAIDVAVHQGRVVLRGPILADEVDALMNGVYAVKGVSWVDNQLEVHESPGTVPGLQGAPRRAAPQFELLKQNWAPGPRVLAGFLGGYLVLRGAFRRDLGSLLAGAAGLALLVRAMSNKSLRALIGFGEPTEGIDVQKTISINAPIDQVFDFLKDPTNFPQIMEHVQAVEDRGNGRFHWIVTGPATVPIEFQTQLTSLKDNEIIAWESTPESLVSQCGIIRLQPENGQTRVQIRLAYAPPAGVVGHGVASLFGTDPKHAFDDGLLRLKSLLETGKTTAHGQAVSRGEMAQ